jgi:hypothetical protein
MATHNKVHAPLTPLPLFPQESLYVGVDIGKFRHVAGFLSRTLLARHERFEGCPTFAFAQSREGFRSFVDRLREYVPLEQATVLYVIYNQGIKQGLLPLLDPLRERGRGLSFSLRRNALWQRYAGNSIR